MVNNVKKIIQKEEYISLAINKYIVQTTTIPKKLNTTTNEYELDWDKLLNDEYLGINFNKHNSLLNKDILIIFDNSNNAFIKGAVDEDENYNENFNYLYNFYINKIFRVNTLPPSDITKTELLNGSQILYSDIQKQIVSLLNSGKKVFLSNATCTKNEYFYELDNNNLTYKYCKSDNSEIKVYQEAPIYLENRNDLQYVKAKIGDSAFVKINGFWYEYYYQGDVSTPWIPSSGGSVLTKIDNTLSIEDRITSYIPESKDLVIKAAGGCMLANGDIFCWGDNKYKRAGIETYGQLDTSLTPDYINTPVMLKVQINDSERKSLRWYNSPYRIKFEKMFMNSRNVCGVSPIYDYIEGGIAYKEGGDLYCNGDISPIYYENIETSNSNQSSILSRNKFFAWGKNDRQDNSSQTINVSADGGPIEVDSNNIELTKTRDEIYIKDVAMTTDTIAVLSDDGKIYTLGKNYNGALGIGSSDKFINLYEPKQVEQDSSIFFEKVFALRDINCFGAIDSNKNFWIWGERSNGSYDKPTRLDDSNKKFDGDYIFVNSSEFILKNLDDKSFFRTSEDNKIQSISSSIPSTAISATIINENNEWKYLYVDKDLKLYGSSELLSCISKSGGICLDLENNIFTFALNKLNNESNFFNVSTYKLDAIVYEEKEDFESGASNWSNNTTTNIPDNGDTTQDPVTRFLGKFPIVSDPSGTPFEVSKTYTYSSYPNYEVEIEFDFYEIGTWDGERFELYVNDELLAVDHFVMDGQDYIQDSNITGISLQDTFETNYWYNEDQKYRYKLRAKLDDKGQLKIKFKTNWEYKAPYENYWSHIWEHIEDDGSKVYEDINNESWGIDNIHIKIKEKDKHFTCAITGVQNESQMYCWGITGRSIPILSTSLYDMDKISNLNKLFITTKNDKNNSMTKDLYDINGYLFVKFPTYIGGFDYPFYFK